MLCSDWLIAHLDKLDPGGEAGLLARGDTFSVQVDPSLLTQNVVDAAGYFVPHIVLFVRLEMKMDLALRLKLH